MNAVVFYSCTGQSRSVAAYFAEQTGFPLADMETAHEVHYQNLVLVFPVHCQNIPSIVKNFLKRITVKHLTVIATYGRMCCGNVLYEIQKNYQNNIVAGAYVPTKHTYIEDDAAFCDYDQLQPIVNKIQNPAYIQLPKIYKNPLSNLFPALRGLLGLKIAKSTRCNGCNLCAELCPFGGIQVGKTNGNCIRCLKCVEKCPHQALTVRLGSPLKLYLRQKKTDKLILYV